MPESDNSTTSRAATHSNAAEAQARVIEPNLLPSWYEQLRRRRRWLKLQIVGSCLVLLGLVLLLIMRHDDEQITRWHLDNLEAGRERTQMQLDTLRVEKVRLNLLLDRASINERIGLPVEITRLLGEIEKAMGRNVFLTHLNVQTVSETIPGSIEARPTRLVLELRGVAQERQAYNAFIREVQSNGLFTSGGNDRITFSRNTGSPGGSVGIEFDITLHVEVALFDYGETA